MLGLGSCHIRDHSMAHRYSKRSDSATPAVNKQPSESAPREEENPNIVVYKKMEAILELMQDPHSGIVVKTVKSFMSKIPSVFTGADLIAWITRNMDVDDQVEALHLANLLGAYGYIFPIDDHILTVKNDGAYYRFQTPCFWPSRCLEPENTDYAVYLCKRTMQNKQRLELVDYEAENLARLQKTFSRKWEFIFIQAEAQAKVDKKRDKLERKVLDSQERAFWDVHRPAPGCVNTTEVDIKKTCRNIKRPKLAIKCGHLGLAGSGNTTLTETEQAIIIESLQKEIERLRKLAERRRIKVSKVAESYLSYFEQYMEFDPFITPPEPSNPWISDCGDFWEQESTTKDIPQRRVKRWSFSVRELLKDTAGREHFRRFLEKEFSAENLKFWEACQRLKFTSQQKINEMVQDIYTEYLAPGARDPVNVDCRVAETVKRNLSQNPNRYCFDEAEDHIYQLMKNDSYNRYLRSEMYKEFLSGTKKKPKRCFKAEVRRLRELTKAQALASLAEAKHAVQPTPAQQQPDTVTVAAAAAAVTTAVAATQEPSIVNV